MQCYKFHSRSGRAHIFTHHQQVALERAEVWNVMQYTFIEAMDSSAKPTWTDAEIFNEHLRWIAFPHIGMFHPQFRDENRAYFVRSPKRTDMDAAVGSVMDALKVARGLYASRVVTMTRGDFPPPYEVAGDLDLVLLTL